ncbi:hypothetical protein [Caballeronia sp. J97]|uniref:hypothetical protein n=1 Tax=Caballeronia sp. J97 TaxID=2805429 RepID=UPI002AB1002F|nr:hypothetical protein [Caballeronia sp. J97]
MDDAKGFNDEVTRNVLGCATRVRMLRDPTTYARLLQHPTIHFCRSKDERPEIGDAAVLGYN